jgi:serine/threonine-protein kinase
MIENLNLAVGAIESQYDRHKPRNVILRHEPLAGYRVTENSPVHLVINRPPGKTAKGNLHRPLYGSLLQHDIKNGFLKKRVRVELENSDSWTDIFDDYVKPGEQLWILIPRDQDTAVFIFENDELVKTEIFEAW